MDKEWTRLSTKQYLTWQWTRNEQDCQPNNTLRGNGQGMNKIVIQTIPYMAMDKEWTRLSTKQYLTWQWTRNEQDCYPNNTIRGNGQGMNKIVIQTIPYVAMDKEWTRLLSKQYLTWQWTRNEQHCYPNNTLHGNGQGMNKIFVIQTIPYMAMDKEWTKLTRLSTKQYLTWQWTRNEQHCYPNNTLHGNGQGMNKINKIVIQTIPYVAMDKEWTTLLSKQYLTWQWTRNEQDFCYPNNTLHGNGQGMNKINKIVNQAIPYVAMDKEWTRLSTKQYLTWQWTRNEQDCYPNNTLHGNGQGMNKIVIQTIPYMAMDKEWTRFFVIQTIPYVAMDKEWTRLTRLSTKQYLTWQWTRNEQHCYPNNTLHGNGQGMKKIFVIQTIPYVAMDKEWTRLTRLSTKQYLTWQWTRNEQDCQPSNTLRGNGQGMNKIVIQTIPYVAMDKEWTRLLSKQYLTWQWTRNEQDCYPNNTLRGNGQGMNKIVNQAIPYVAMDKEWTRLSTKQYLTWQWTRNEQDCQPSNLYINLRRSHDCLCVSVAAGRPVLFCLPAGMAVFFYVAGYLIEERRRWPVITASPWGQCSK